MKICGTCNIEKESYEFDGNRNHCKKCNRNKYYQKLKMNLYETNIIEKTCSKCNLIKNIYEFRTHKTYCKKCENKQTYESRKDIQSINNSEYLKIYQKFNKETINKRMRIYKKTRIKTDVIFKLSMIIRGTIVNSIKLYGFKKSKKTLEILGINAKEFRLYLESKFEPWMNWENYGKYNGELNYGWDIDHIIPTSSAKTEEDVYKLNHYTNLQPLCSYINGYIKKDKMDY